MKRIMSRSYIVLFVTIAFFAGMGFLAFRIITQHNDWVQRPYPPNYHLSSSNGLGQAGAITDRNEAMLAYSDQEGQRHYNEDLTTRKALMHVVGDNSMNISTSIQSMYRTKLTGYTFAFGLEVPQSLKRTSDVQLTVDANASVAAYNALGSNKGACIVYNYKTGEVLCSTSTYSYDPEDPPEITEENEKDYDGVYLDNVTSSTFTPGSTFKIITAASAIEHIPDIYTQTFTCTGEYEIEGSKITCENAHGELSFEDAFACSCNCAFAQISQQLGRENLTETAQEMGFNKGYHMSDIPLEKSYFDVKKAGDNELAWAGIGQYTDLANPTHMSMIAAAVASGGTATEPYIVKNDADIIRQLGIQNPLGADRKMLTPSVAEKVKDLMRGAANRYANVSGLSIAGLNFCAKTGTAEVEKGKEPTAWLVGFTEDDAHPYAFAAVVVEGGYGISAAASVVSAAVSALV